MVPSSESLFSQLRDYLQSLEPYSAYQCAHQFLENLEELYSTLLIKARDSVVIQTPSEESINIKPIRHKDPIRYRKHIGSSRSVNDKESIHSQASVDDEGSVRDEEPFQHREHTRDEESTHTEEPSRCPADVTQSVDDEEIGQSQVPTDDTQSINDGGPVRIEEATNDRGSVNIAVPVQNQESINDEELFNDSTFIHLKLLAEFEVWHQSGRIKEPPSLPINPRAVEFYDILEASRVNLEERYEDATSESWKTIIWEDAKIQGESFLGTTWLSSNRSGSTNRLLRVISGMRLYERKNNPRYSHLLKRHQNRFFRALARIESWPVRLLCGHKVKQSTKLSLATNDPQCVELMVRASEDFKKLLERLSCAAAVEEYDRILAEDERLMQMWSTELPLSNRAFSDMVFQQDVQSIQGRKRTMDGGYGPTAKRSVQIDAAQSVPLNEISQGLNFSYTNTEDFRDSSTGIYFDCMNTDDISYASTDDFRDSSTGIYFDCMNTDDISYASTDDFRDTSTGIYFGNINDEVVSPAAATDVSTLATTSHQCTPTRNDRMIKPFNGNWPQHVAIRNHRLPGSVNVS